MISVASEALLLRQLGAQALEQRRRQRDERIVGISVENQFILFKRNKAPVEMEVSSLSLQTASCLIGRKASVGPSLCPGNRSSPNRVRCQGSGRHSNGAPAPLSSACARRSRSCTGKQEQREWCASRHNVQARATALRNDGPSQHHPDRRIELHVDPIRVDHEIAPPWLCLARQSRSMHPDYGNLARRRSRSVGGSAISPPSYLRSL